MSGLPKGNRFGRDPDTLPITNFPGEPGRYSFDRGSMSKTPTDPSFRMFLIPCSCGTTFAVAENRDRQGSAWSRYLKCPRCEKRHDPRNRVLQLGYQREGYWRVDQC